MKELRFIDLFAGIGGIRKGLELASIEAGYNPVCVFTSEIKPHAISILKQNHPNEKIYGDITKISSYDIPDFDILCAGFPCQAFSSAGRRLGFADTRGTLFFEVERIIHDKKPKGFILENVEGLVNHDNGNTLKVILTRLNDLGYKVSFKVLNAINFGVPQDRKRIYIVGTLHEYISLDNFEHKQTSLDTILEKGIPSRQTKLASLLLSKFSISELYGKSIKDKRGGKDNIHSWDIGLKGDVSIEERTLLNLLLKERRKKKWAEIIGIDWMDGMPLTKKQVEEFYQHENLQLMLDNLVNLGYLKFEYPKKLVKVFSNGIKSAYRQYDETKAKGYNIVTGKLSFEINKILDPAGVAPTLVAMDMNKLYVIDNGNLRRLTLREGLRLFGYPDDYKFDIPEKQGYDLLGITVAVPVLKAISERLIKNI